MSRLAPIYLLLLCLAASVLPVLRVDGLSLRVLLASSSPPKAKNVLVDIRVAQMPKDLDTIRECRMSDPEVVTTAPPRFLNADSLATGLWVGIIAKERLYPFRVLGTTDVCFGKQSGRAFVQNVYVRQEARGLGLGRKMMDFVEELALTSGKEVDRLELNVDTNNTVAVSFYEKCGFYTPGIHWAVSKLGKTAGLPLQVAMSKTLS